jgi:hypothetical protein
LIEDVNNCPVHRSMTTESLMKTQDMVSVPHPPYAPDPAPGDLPLFPTDKERPERDGTTNEDQLFDEFHIILRLILVEELERVFEAWRERV